MKIPSELALEELSEIKLSSYADNNDLLGEFEMLAYTGQAVNTFGFPVVFDLAGMAIPSMEKLAILKQHDPNQIVGLPLSCKKDSELRLTGKLFQDHGPSNEVRNLASQGLKWQASMGVSALEVEHLGEGEAREVNGREFSGPGLVVTRSALKESSFVPLGADSDTRATVLDGSRFISPQEVTMSEDTKPDPVAVERKRVAEINAAFAEKDAQFALKAISEGISLSDAKAQWADVVEAKLADREAELASQAAELEAAKKRTQPVATSTVADPGNGLSAKERFSLAVKEYRAKGIPSVRAVQLADEANPGLRLEMLTEVNGGRH